MDNSTKLTINKTTANVPIRVEDGVDLTAIRIGKQRVARNKKTKVSDLKTAILLHRDQTKSAETASPPQVVETQDLDQSDLKQIVPAFIDQSQSTELDEIVFASLKELTRLQAKGKDQAPEKRYKYKKFVVGIREVDRAVNRTEAKGVIVAFNLEWGIDALDKQIMDLRKACIEEEIPFFFALNKRKLGKALDKSMKQSIVGIVNLDGIHQQWRKILELVEDLRNNIPDGTKSQSGEIQV